MSEKYEITDMDCAYAAGLLDGEGCIHIQFTRSELVIRNRRGRHQLMVSFAMSTLEPILTMQRKFGGKLYIKPYHQYGDQIQWRLFDHKGLDFLHKVLPYLVLKVEEALAVLDWPMPGRGHNLTQEEFDQREQMRETVLDIREGRKLVSEQDIRRELSA